MALRKIGHIVHFSVKMRQQPEPFFSSFEFIFLGHVNLYHVIYFNETRDLPVILNSFKLFSDSMRNSSIVHETKIDQDLEDLDCLLAQKVIKIMTHFIHKNVRYFLFYKP